MKNDSGDMQQQIFHTACEMFYEEGYNNVSIREIASKLGITHQTVWYYFESKEGLGYAIWSKHRELLLMEALKIFMNINTEDRIPESGINIYHYLILKQIEADPKFGKMYVEIRKSIDISKYKSNNGHLLVFDSLQDYFGKVAYLNTKQEYEYKVIAQSVIILCEMLLKGDISIIEASLKLNRLWTFLICDGKGITEEQTLLIHNQYIENYYFDSQAVLDRLFKSGLNS